MAQKIEFWSSNKDELEIQWTKCF